MVLLLDGDVRFPWLLRRGEMSLLHISALLLSSSERPPAQSKQNKARVSFKNKTVLKTLWSPWLPVKYTIDCFSTSLTTTDLIFLMVYIVFGTTQDSYSISYKISQRQRNPTSPQLHLCLSVSTFFQPCHPPFCLCLRTLRLVHLLVNSYFPALLSAHLPLSPVQWRSLIHVSLGKSQHLLSSVSTHYSGFFYFSEELVLPRSTSTATRSLCWPWSFPPLWWLSPPLLPEACTMPWVGKSMVHPSPTLTTSPAWPGPDFSCPSLPPHLWLFV